MTMSERIVVCGSRDWDDVHLIGEVMAHFPEGTVVMHGAARGADSIAATWAENFGFEVLAFPAQWQRYGRRAGSIRNQQMLDEGEPTRVVAFRKNGRSVGTDDMIRRSRAAGVPVEVFPPRNQDIKGEKEPNSDQSR